MNDGTIRCAIYTRKSTEEGLEQEFNSLDAQRESGEAYVSSMKHEGWVCMPTRYDDGGYSGGNADRPALKRLLDDIEAGKIDCVVVYKVDRLSRSLLDFARLMETFETHNVSFVSVTQQFSTTNSMGRLTLNILFSFAQFERDIISERTRDKMAAARRKGKYVGGAPVLGYDIDRDASRLVVNDAEALRVRQIFELYLEHEALLPVIAELDQRGWKTKQWVTKKGNQRGGKPFTKTGLHSLLTNIIYVGKICYKTEQHEGQHDAVVDAEMFARVQKLLQRNHRAGGKDVRNRFGALLKGLLRCTPCGCAMIHSHTHKEGKKRYRYYVCGNAQKRGWDNCPSKSIPAAEIEKFVVDQIRAIGHDPGLIAETLSQARLQVEEKLSKLAEERGIVENDLARAGVEIRDVAADVGACGDESPASARLADLNERLRLGEKRLAEIREEDHQLRSELIHEDDVADALAAFDPVWDALSPREQAHVLELLVERVEYDGAEGSVSVTFHPTGIRTLNEEFVIGESAA